jgi:hypothetical protein
MSDSCLLKSTRAVVRSLLGNVVSFHVN